ncbi:MAG TPA: IS110 family transposase, partial [Roseiarcus sp.]
MTRVEDHHCAKTAIRENIGAIFVSMELSRSTGLLTSLSPGGTEKTFGHSLAAGDLKGLFDRFTALGARRWRAGKTYPIVVIQEAGLDWFRIHRALENEGIESHVVDAASIATSRRRRRAK